MSSIGEPFSSLRNHRKTKWSTKWMTIIYRVLRTPCGEWNISLVPEPRGFRFLSKLNSGTTIGVSAVPWPDLNHILNYLFYRVLVSSTFLHLAYKAYTAPLNTIQNCNSLTPHTQRVCFAPMFQVPACVSMHRGETGNRCALLISTAMPVLPPQR